MPTPHCDDPRVQRVVSFYEGLGPADLPRLAELYSADARFKDPFNEVQGVAAVRGIFEHMFAALHEPRFVVHEAIVQGGQCFLVWDFVFRMKRFSDAQQTIRGGSHLRFDAQGRVAWHRDYWDAAEELYEKLPVVGGLMRWLKRRATR
jgi:ketosteroid isomerase-like protein